MGDPLYDQVLKLAIDLAESAGACPKQVHRLRVMAHTLRVTAPGAPKSTTVVRGRGKGARSVQRKPARAT
jgi:hypothetical protein